MRLSAALLLILLTACGKDSSGPSTPNVTGNWIYNTSNLSGGGLSCSSFGTAMMLTQQGTTFSGSYSGGTLSCVGVGSSNIGTGTVVSGILAGANGIAFDMDTQDWRNTGTITGTSMSGTVRVKVNDGTTDQVLNGSFAASRP
jgi:hypothetical protein